MGYVSAGAAVVSALTAGYSAYDSHQAAGRAATRQKQAQSQAVDAALSQQRKEAQEFAEMNPKTPDLEAILAGELRAEERRNRPQRPTTDFDALFSAEEEMIGGSPTTRI